ncbi:MAG TPA: RDD family protein [Chitinophaga sp.]
MAAIKIPTAFNIDLEFEAADISQRFVAWLIDLAVRMAWLILVWVVAANSFSGPAGNIFAFWAIGLPLSLYFLVFEVLMRGQTPGKKAMSLKVVSMLGNPPSYSQHMIRWVFRILESPIVFWGVVPIISIARSKYNQRLGDVVAGTIVVNTKTKSTLNDTIFREVSQTDYQPHFPQILRLSDKDLNKVKELMDRALKSGNLELAAKVSYRVRDVLKIETEMDHMQFLETLLNDYNYYVTKD